MNIRYATMADLDDIASVESVCFPVLEAATKEEFEQRIKYFGNHFWLMFDEGKLIAFVVLLRMRPILQMRCMKMHQCIMRMVHGR